MAHASAIDWASIRKLSRELGPLKLVNLVHDIEPNAFAFRITSGDRVVSALSGVKVRAYALGLLFLLSFGFSVDGHRVEC